MAWDITPGNSSVQDFMRMRDEMDRLLNAFIEGKSNRESEEVAAWSPTLDVSETESEILVEAEIPEIDPKDIDISLAGDTLTIKGEKKQEKEGGEEDFHLIERSYGSFNRSVQLPREVQVDKIKASYKTGVLKITLPKSEEAKKREIKIKVE